MVVDCAQNCRRRSDVRQEAADLELLRVETPDLELVQITIGGVPHELYGFPAEKCLGGATIRTIARANFRSADERGGYRARDDDDGDERQAESERNWHACAGCLRFVHAAPLGPPQLRTDEIGR